MRPLERLRARLAPEQGFTLVELMVAVSVGVVVLFGALLMIDVSRAHYQRTDDRVATASQGRAAMQGMVRELRSQACVAARPASDPAGLEDRPALISAQADSVTFTADLGADTFTPDIHRLQYAAPVGSPLGTLTGHVFAGSGNTPDRSFPGYPGSPTRTRELADRVSTNSSGPLFRYFRDDAAGEPVDELTSPLASADLGSVSRIAIAFRIEPRGARSQPATFTHDVYMRKASRAAGGELCQ